MIRKAIGGYFELETVKKEIYLHAGLLALNTARNSFEYILLARKFTHVYIPYFTCDVMLEPIDKLGLSYSFYDVDDHLEPVFDYGKIQDNEAFLITNYFGIKGTFIRNVALQIPNLIVDNAQALFDQPLPGIDTFYSPRKFLGVADGGFLAINQKLNEDFEQDLSYNRMSHLLKRIDLSPEDGYGDFSMNDQSLENQPIKLMSKLTTRILNGVDYDFIQKRRKENFLFLHEALKDRNSLSLDFDKDAVPMVYPFRTKQKELKEKLIKEKIYSATYWPNVLKWANKDKNAYQLTEEIIALPIDQRQTRRELKKILTIIK